MRKPDRAATSNSRGTTAVASFTRRWVEPSVSSTEEEETPSTAQSAAERPVVLAIYRESDPGLLAHDLHQFFVRAVGQHAAVVHDPDAMRELLSLFHVVGGIEDRHPLAVEAPDPVEDGPPALRIDAHRGFVQDEEARLVQERRADVDPTLHATRIVLEAFLLPIDEIDEFEDGIDAAGQLGPSKPVHLAPEIEVLAGGEVRVERYVLGHDSKQALDRGRVLKDRVPTHPCVAPGGSQETGKDGDGGGLSRAVRSQQAVDLTLFDREREIVDGDCPLGWIELLVEQIDFDEAHPARLPYRPVLLRPCFPGCGPTLARRYGAAQTAAASLVPRIPARQAVTGWPDKPTVLLQGR